MKELIKQLFIWTSVSLTVLFCILCFWEDKEIAFMMIPLAGLLSQIGGTWKKQIRRFVIPAMIAAVPIGFFGFNWLFLVAGAAALVLAVLPFTLIGDSVPESWANWAWIVVLGLIAGLVALPVALATDSLNAYLSVCWVPVLTLIVFGMGSNIRGLSWFFKWKFCEFAFWAAVVFPICQIINN